MARPKKDNAEYYTHDKDMRNDPKIKALRKKFKHEGYSIWNMLLEHLTDCNFFEYEYNDLNIELLAGDFDIDTETLKQIIDYCVLLKLIVIENGLIFSYEHQKRFESLLSKRKRERIGVIADDNTHSRVEDIILDESEEKESGKKSAPLYPTEINEDDLPPKPNLITIPDLKAYYEEQIIIARTEKDTNLAINYHSLCQYIAENLTAGNFENILKHKRYISFADYKRLIREGINNEAIKSYINAICCKPNYVYGDLHQTIVNWFYKDKK